jgi:hypothetical protein
VRLGVISLWAPACAGEQVRWIIGNMGRSRGKHPAEGIDFHLFFL